MKITMHKGTLYQMGTVGANKVRDSEGWLPINYTETVMDYDLSDLHSVLPYESPDDWRMVCRDSNSRTVWAFQHRNGMEVVWKDMQCDNSCWS